MAAPDCVAPLASIPSLAPKCSRTRFRVAAVANPVRADKRVRKACAPARRQLVEVATEISAISMPASTICAASPMAAPTSALTRTTAASAA
jgi:hypothetical protein